MEYLKEINLTPIINETKDCTNAEFLRRSALEELRSTAGENRMSTLTSPKPESPIRIINNYWRFEYQSY